MMRAWIALCLFLSPATAAAQSEHERPQKLQRIQGERFAKLWAEELQEAERLLLEGEAKKAFKKAEGVNRRIADNVVGGAGAGVFIGQAMAIQAIAAVELGRRDEGLWRWQIASQFFPDLAAVDLGLFGAAGEYLASPPVPEVPSNGGQQGGGAMTPARWTHQPDPRWPRARQNVPTVTVVVRFVMDVDGRLKNPEIVDAAGELTMLFATLEAISRWKFEPATVGGQPVPMVMQQSFTFRVRG